VLTITSFIHAVEIGHHVAVLISSFLIRFLILLETTNSVKIWLMMYQS